MTAYALANCTQNPRLVRRNSRIAEPLSRLPTAVSYVNAELRKKLRSASACAYGVVAPASPVTCRAICSIAAISDVAGRLAYGATARGTAFAVDAICLGVNRVPASGGSSEATT